MTYTNLPPTLFEMFGSLDDRVRKLETGPSLAYATGYDALQQAQSAQFGAIQAYSVATDAQVQAINASAQANIAQSQATVAQATASFSQSLAYAAQATANSASAQATVAQNTANGKNKVYYSLVTPGSTANSAGDIWFQYSGSGLVIGQYVGLGGTSWQQQTITQAVIGNLDAGKVTTGILNAIEITAGSGSQIFRVTPTGYLSAQGAYIKGNITADSGTFNGTVNASAGLFGNYAGGNYWSISSTGLTAVGTGTITGGLIQGSSIQVPQTSPLFVVNSAGQLQATSADISGKITATSGNIAGWDISSTQLSISSIGNYINSSGVAVFSQVGTNTNQLNSFAGPVKILNTLETTNSLTVGTSITAGTSGSLLQFFSSTGVLNVQQAYNFVATGRSLNVSSGGNFGTTASTIRKKHEIANYAINENALLQLQVKTFKYKPEIDADQIQQYGFIAEDAEALGLNELIQYDKDNLPDYFAYEKLPIFLLQLAQSLNKRLKKLEGN